MKTLLFLAMLLLPVTPIAETARMWLCSK